MGVRDRFVALFSDRADPPMSLDGYLQQLQSFLYGGHLYQLGLNQTLRGSNEPIDTSFGSAYKANGVVFACMLARMSIFSEARFVFRKQTDARPGDLFGGTDGRNPGFRDLDLLAHPWPNGTTGDMLARAIQDVDLAGNAFFARRAGPRIRRLRPDWVSIVLATTANVDNPGWDIDAEIAGYLYFPGGRGTGVEPESLLPEEVAHFAPIPDPIANYRGMSWLTPLMREIAADNAATGHKLKFFENGATPNMIVKLAEVMAGTTFEETVRKFRMSHEGIGNAYKTLLLGSGMDATVVGANLQQMEFKVTQGAGETRIAAAAGVHPSLVGLSEGLQGSSLNAGNFGAARRVTADKTFRPLWRNLCGSFSTIVTTPPGAELWYDERDIAFLREDRKDASEIQQIKAQTIRSLIDGGFKAQSVVDAVEAEDMGLLKHTGLFSVQLQAPGSTRMPVGETPGETPVGPGTKPETIPPGDVSTKPLAAGTAKAPKNGSKP